MDSLLGYVATVATSKLPFNGKGTKEWFKASVVTQAPLEYFSMRTLGEEALEAVKGERVLFGLHPHGVYRWTEQCHTHTTCTVRR